MWLAALNGRSAPRRVTAHDGAKAFFGAGDDVFFLGEGNGAKYIYHVKEDGSELQKVVRTSAGADKFSVSPDGKWVVIVPNPTDEMVAPVMLYPVGGGSPTLICGPCTGNNLNPGRSIVSWSPDGKFFYLNFQRSVYAIPLRPGQILPSRPQGFEQSKMSLLCLGRG